jgi:glutathione S-transferase
MILKLIGHSWSTSTKRVLAILKETNTPFEFKEISWVKAEHKSPEFAEKQPFNQIPYLVCTLLFALSQTLLT